ncbi:MAG: dimethylargininase [Terriglobales bacterium]
MRSYLMCPPAYFDVTYAINAWMDPSIVVDRDLAMRQWSTLRDTYIQLGHHVELLEPVAELPDMVFAANGAFSVAGSVVGARFRYPQRVAEAAVHRTWYADHGWPSPVVPSHINEGEGDLAYVAARGLILAGYGFRTDPAAHPEISEALACPVVSLRLVDERFYHLNLALFVLDDDNVAYFPNAFSAASQRTLRRLFPDALIVTYADADAFGPNAVSDGHHVVMPVGATHLEKALADRGFEVICIDVSELRKGGGSVKCCTAELRGVDPVDDEIPGGICRG